MTECNVKSGGAVKTVVKVNLEFAARDAVKAVRRRDLIVIIDVLRFSSSVLNAFANGANEVIPTKTLREAYDLHREHPECLLAGERRGVKPRRFDFGNSPLEFTREKVCGKTLVFTTTSGTAALTNSRQAEWVLVGALLNASLVGVKAAEIAEKEETGVSLVLSGRKGRFSFEDFLCGGAIAEALHEKSAVLSDAAFAALMAFKQFKENLCERIMMGEHAKHLTGLGFKGDVEFSCQLDLFKIVPIYKGGRIRLLK
ncbi:MAG: 2-phosphosulfolactate phosphatase [Candidatus Bathyarchaeota archaeon]|nr:2-phosphosulfolactate phosphatase [Candidatus Bathyarchaeota archaeon]